MKNPYEVLIFAEKYDACGRGYKWSNSQHSLYEAWESCKDPSIILWTLKQLNYKKVLSLKKQNEVDLGSQQ